MAFQRRRIKTGGRVAGVPNKATIEIKEFARSILEDSAYQMKLKQRILDGSAPQIEQLLFYYLHGRPKQEADSKDPIRVIVYGPNGIVSPVRPALPHHSVNEAETVEES